MRLLLHHPNLPACSTCQKYIVDYSWTDGSGTGEIQTWGDPSDPQPHLRPSVCPPPCGSCPKKSPAREREFVLNDRNWRTLKVYREAKSLATVGVRGLDRHAASDSILRRNFSFLEQLFTAAERERLAESLAEALHNTLARPLFR